MEINNGERRGGIIKRDKKNAFLNLEFIFLIKKNTNPKQPYTHTDLLFQTIFDRLKALFVVVVVARGHDHEGF